jgi:hypothetical protein
MLSPPNIEILAKVDGKESNFFLENLPKAYTV